VYHHNRVRIGKPVEQEVGMADSTAPNPEPRRPRAVSFVASLLFIEASLVVLVGVVVATAQVAARSLAIGGADVVFGPILDVLPGLSLAIVVVVAGGGLLLAGVGLLRMREWGWSLAMALQGLILVNSLYAYFGGQPQYLALAIASFVVLVLNQREVRQAFEAQRHHV
jgi:hypothetical protein